MQWVILLVGLDIPAALALLDCINRSPDQFEGGTGDRAGWLRWLIIALPLSWVLIGYGIVLGYYYSVVRRNTPARF
jgi:hypothetical protein